MRNKKILFTIISLLVMIFAIAIPGVSMAGGKSCTYNVKLVQPRIDENSYSINNGNYAKRAEADEDAHKIWNLVHRNKEDPRGYEDVNLYCMCTVRDGYKWPLDSIASDWLTYDRVYELKTEKDDIINDIFGGVTDSTVAKEENGKYVANKYPYIEALCDIMYDPFDEDTKAAEKEKLLTNAGLEANDLTDGEITAIQQVALWHFTNKGITDDRTHQTYTGTTLDQTLPIDWFWVKSSDASSYVKASADKRTKAGKLYYYLLSTATNVGNNVYKDAETIVTRPITVTAKGAKLVDDKYGPIKITKNNKLPYELNIAVTDGLFNVVSGSTTIEGSTGSLGNAIEYTLVDSNGSTISDINTYTGKFYVKFKNDDFNTAFIQVTPKWDVASAVVYTVAGREKGDSTPVQPAIRFSKKRNSKAYTFSVTNEKTFDLALRKYITKVDGNDLTGDYERELHNIDITKLASGDDTTATYKHTKKPVKVEENSVVKYAIKIYNEGEQDGVAEDIVDQLPAGLVSNLKTGDTVTSHLGNTYTVTYDTTNNKITFSTAGQNATVIPAFNDTTLSFDKISFDCTVTATASTEDITYLTNIAWISKEYNAEKNLHITNQNGADVDSEPSTIPKVDDKETITPTKDNMEDYHGSGKSNLSDKNYFYEGRQDDDDFEKVYLDKEVVPEGKYNVNIVKVDSSSNAKLSGAVFTVNGIDKTATDSNGNTIIENNKDITAAGQIITYEIVEKTAPNGYAKFDGKITLTVETKSQDNNYVIDTAKTTMTVEDSKGNPITSDIPVTINKSTNSITLTVKDTKLDGSYSIQLVKEDANGENLKEPATFEVTNRQTNTTETKTTQNSKLDITNGAVQITSQNVNTPDVYVIKETKAPDEYCKFDGIITITVNKKENNGDYSIDGTPTYTVTDSEGKDITNQTGDTVAVEVKNGNIYVNVKNYQFDLALRKFIAQVNDVELKTPDGKSYLREPEVDTSKLNTYDSTGKKITTAIYNHPKTPVEVKKGDTVIYILRVYNEGDMDGYATEIKDHLPEYLEFVKGEFNDKYKWTVSDDGRTVTSTYLESQLIAKPTKNSSGKLVLSYKDLPIMCKVKDTAKTQEAITNIADITEYKDKEKKEVKDRDSDSDNVKLPTDEELPKYKDDETGTYIPGQEDDDDFEKLIIYEFDLALRKWVTQAIVIEDGKETVTNTGHDAWDNPEEVVKVELHRKKLSNVTVKFRYSIRVYNQGDVEGYAKEITDYVPQGLKFLAEDNPDWVDEGNNIISTRKLENTLLKPDEYADVEVVLTWINGQDNIGLKVNTAEISEDYNDKGLKDKDSTPDNQAPGEDDIDDAPVILSIETGREVVFIGLGMVILVTLGAGIHLIRKYVL